MNSSDDNMTGEDSPEPVEPTIRCDMCGNLVAASFTSSVPRVYLGTTFDETWCTPCVTSAIDNGSRASKLDEDDDLDY